MSDRIKGLVVTFKTDLHEQQAEAIQNAIALMSAVLEVRPLVANPQSYIDRSRVAHKLIGKINDLILEEIT